MRRILVAAAAVALSSSLAFAADMPTKAPGYKAPVMATVYDWTGFHVGVQGGYAWGDVDASNPSDGNTFHNNLNGGFGGVNAGYDFQTDSLVLGLLAEINAASIKGNGLWRYGDTGEFNTQWFGSIDGRVGAAFNQNLFYAIGGFAFANMNHTIDSVPIGSKTFTGWNGGVGVAHAFSQNWSGFVEYRHYNFHNESFPETIIGQSDIVAHNVAFMFDVVKTGFSFKF